MPLTRRCLSSERPRVLSVRDLLVRFLSSGGQKTGQLGRELAEIIASAGVATIASQHCPTMLKAMQPFVRACPSRFLANRVLFALRSISIRAVARARLSTLRCTWSQSQTPSHRHRSIVSLFWTWKQPSHGRRKTVSPVSSICAQSKTTT